MSQVDEGLIHAWLDGQLPSDEAARVEQLVASDSAWGAAAAEARGLVAGASRILGALDQVPTLRNANPALGGSVPRRAVRRSWTRAPWIRAAAVIAIVAGVGSLAWPRVGEQRVAPAKKEADASQRSEIAADKRPVVEQAPPTSQSATGSRSPAASPARSSQDASAQAKQRVDETRLSARPPAPSGATSAGAAVPLAAAGVAAVRDSLGAAKPAPVVVLDEKKTFSGVRAGGGGRGAVVGRASPVVETGRIGLADRAAVAKSLAVPTGVDPRLAGCWVPLDSTAGFARNELRERDAFVLRFVDPVVTDVPGVVRQMPVPTAPIPPAAPVNARIQNVTPNATSDSTFTTEWTSGAGRVFFTFAIRGDTIRGTTRLSAGDLAYPLAPFRAARAQCPR